MGEPLFGRVTILGVGLIGASLALAMKRHGLARTIVGYGRREGTLRAAAERRIIDTFSTDPANACCGSDLIVLATPAGTFHDLIGKALPFITEGAIVTDVGSVKGRLVPEMEHLLAGKARFVGAHPIAGSEQSGIDAADAGLFVDAKCIITPTGRSDPGALALVVSLWELLGADVVSMEPDEHDRIFGAVSHFPHLVAFAIMNAIGDADGASLAFCGSGLRDMTRIAKSSPTLWADICMRNRENLVGLIDVFQKNLASLRDSLAAPDADAILAAFQRARNLRKGLG